MKKSKLFLLLSMVILKRHMCVRHMENNLPFSSDTHTHAHTHHPCRSSDVDKNRSSGPVFPWRWQT